jgi:hypothetical protein
MTTTFKMIVLGAAMEHLFDNATDFSVRFYENLTIKEDEEFNEDKKYKYNIIIRHPEETNGKELFVKAISEFKTQKTTTP